MPEVAPEGSGEVEVLLFEIGTNIYGADAREVLRVSQSGRGAFMLPALGELAAGRRALVFRGEGDLAGQLRVDIVHGVRSVAVQTLRRMPAPAAAHPYAVGVWLDGDRPVLLIDLKEGLRYQGKV